MNRQKVLLAILVACFIGAGVYAYLRSPHQEEVASLKYRPGMAAPLRRGTKAPAARAEQGGLNVALLERELPRYSGYRRNLFAPIFREEVKSAPVKKLPLPPPPLPLPPPPKNLPVPPPPAPPAPPPVDPDVQELSKFTFLGFLSKDGGKTVFLSKNNEIFLAKKGSTVAGRFKVTELTDDALTLTATSSGKELVIPLVENRALTPQRSGRRIP